MRHPYAAAAAVLYVSVKERDKIAALAREGWEIVEDVGGRVRDSLEPIGEFHEQYGFADTLQSPGATEIGALDFIKERIGVPTKKKTSKFNKAVSAGMKAVKKSKFLGKAGTLSNPKAAFGKVTKVTSKVKKGAKVSTKGVTGVIKRAVKRIL
jgi:hypothetical protein